MRINTNIKAKDHLRATLSDFRGLDSSKAVLDIAKTRSSSMRNFINIDGVNRKRNGWEQKLQFLDSNGKPMQINGVFNFELNNTEFFIVYAGTTFYSIDENFNKTDITGSAKELWQKGNKYLLKNQRTQCFISNNKAYFIGCGDYLVFGLFNNVYELRRVRTSDETYIPTTTIHGTSDDSGVKKSLDDINLISGWRKNTFFTGNGTSGSIYKFDTYKKNENETTHDNATNIKFVTNTNEREGYPIDFGSQVTINITYVGGEVTLKNKAPNGAVSRKILSYGMDLSGAHIQAEDLDVWLNTCNRIKVGEYIQTVDYGTNGFPYSGKIIMELDENGYKELNVYYQNQLYATIFNENTGYELGQYDNMELPSGFGKIERIYNKLGHPSLTFSDLIITYIIAPSHALYEYSKDIDGVETWGAEAVGSIVVDYPTYDYGRICGIRLDFEHGATGTEDNMEVTFSKTAYDYSQMISDCSIGTLFGANGNTDRLFLTGNDDYKNIVFHSAQNDFTYFSDLDTQVLGSNNSAVMGFQRLTDSTLAIYKEPSRQEPNLYIVSTDTYNIDTDTMKVIFPTSGSYIAEGLISKYAVGAIANDPLILSKNGVFGVELSSNVTSQERFTRERSRPINALLKTHDLSKAVSLIFDNRYYLCVDSKCYVADSRYRYSLDKDMDDTFSYEWWLLDNLPARVFGIVNNEIWFGTEDGRLCKFDDKFTDRKYDTTYSGEIAFANNEFTYNQNISVLDLADNDIVRFTTDVFTQILDTSGYTVSNNRIVCPDEVITTLVNGTEVYADNVNGTGLSTGIKYIISDIDLGNCTFALIRNGTIATITGTGFKLHKNLKNVNVKLIDVDIESHTFKIASTLGGEPITISQYNGTTPTGLIMDFCTIDNVVAEWYTGAFDFGASDYSKSLLGLTIVSDQTVNSKISFGYETRSLLGLLNNNKGSYREQRTPSFDFSHLDFENFTFETAFTRAYTKRLKVRNFNHIMFVIKSEDDNDCAVYSITVTYKVNRINKGVN